MDAALPGPVVELREHHVGAVDLVARSGEVLPDWAELGAPAEAVSQEPGRLRLAGVVAGQGMLAQFGLQVRLMVAR
jgi:hypothetical protein